MISQRIIQNVQEKNICLFPGHYLYNMRYQIPAICWWFPKKFSPDLSCLKSSVTWEAIMLLFAIENYEKLLVSKLSLFSVYSTALSRSIEP